MNRLQQCRAIGHNWACAQRADTDFGPLRPGETWHCLCCGAIKFLDKQGRTHWQMPENGGSNG